METTHELTRSYSAVATSATSNLVEHVFWLNRQLDKAREELLVERDAKRALEVRCAQLSEQIDRILFRTQNVGGRGVGE